MIIMNIFVSVSKSNEICKKEIFINPAISYIIRDLEVYPGGVTEISPTVSKLVDKLWGLVDIDYWDENT